VHELIGSITVVAVWLSW